MLVTLFVKKFLASIVKNFFGRQLSYRKPRMKISNLIVVCIIIGLSSADAIGDAKQCNPGICIDCSKSVSSNCTVVVKKLKVEYGKFNKGNKSITVSVKNDKKIQCTDDATLACVCDLLIKKINSQSNSIRFTVNKTTHGVKVTELQPTGRSAHAKGGTPRTSSSSSGQLNENISASVGSDYGFNVTCDKDAKSGTLRLMASFVRKDKDQITTTTMTPAIRASKRVTENRSSSQRSSGQRVRSQKLRLPSSTASVNQNHAVSRIDVDMNQDAKDGNVVIKVGQTFSLIASIKGKMKGDANANDTLRSEKMIDAKIKGVIRKKREVVSGDAMDEDAMFIDPILASSSENVMMSSTDLYQDAGESFIANAVTLRIFLPPFIAFKKVTDMKDADNKLGVDSTDGLVIKVGSLKRDEEIKLKLDLVMSDALNMASIENSSGFKDANVIIPFVAQCSFASPSKEILKSGGTSKSKDTFDEKSLSEGAKYTEAAAASTVCSPFKHVSVKIEPVACDNPLGMDTGIITDCQIDSSSSFNASTLPWNARPSSDHFWSPIFDLDIEHYLMIDLRRPTRLTSVQFVGVPDHAKVSAFTVYGINVHANKRSDAEWILLKKYDSVEYDKRGRSKGLTILDTDHHGVKSVTKIKIVIRNVTYDGVTSTSNLVAVKLELFGCYLKSETPTTIEQKEAGTCIPGNHSMVNVGREYSVNTKQNMALVCDNYGSLSERRCFISHESSIGYWINLGNLLSSLVGFDSASERFIAKDYSNRNYLTTKDGNVWTPITDTEAIEIMNSPSFEMKQSGVSTLSAMASFGTPTVKTPRRKSAKDDDSSAKWSASKEALISKDKKPTIVWI